MAEDLIDAAGFPGDIAADTTITPLNPPGYELLDKIGHGGMGVVYRARDIALDRDVALKLLSERYPAGSPAAQRFLSEARITGQLQHPGIPAVHQVDTLADGRPFLAMKLIKGSTLEVILKQRSETAAKRGRLLAIFEAVCQAVGYAHSHRVIHRDLKPANVMVGAFGEVQVMDWGLAKVLGEETPATEEALAAELTRAWTQVSPTPDAGSYTQAGSLVGTPAFIPPEQACGEIDRVNERADVFGLGALLTVILTGQPPYVGETFESVRVQALRGKLEDCFARLDGCGAEPELVALSKKCLAFEPADRPADAGAVAAAVAALRAAADERARLAELERVRAEGETREALARAAEQRRRRRIVLTASGVIALVFLAGFAGVFWQWRVAETARHQADKSQQETEKALGIVESQKSEVEASLAKAEAEEEASRKLLYTTDMQLAPFVWKDDRSTAAQLRALLAKHNPDSNAPALGAGLPAPPTAALRPDLRGFEWYYYQHLIDNSAAVFSGHETTLTAGTLASDAQLVTLDANGQVRRWDVDSQSEEEVKRRDLPGGPNALVRVLSPDGRLAALAEGDKVRVFDTSTGKETCEIESANDDFRRLIFSQDSARLVIVDDQIRWLSAVSGEVIAAVDQKFGGKMWAGRSARSLALSADGLTLAVVGHGRGDTQFSIFRLDETAKKVNPLAKDAGWNGTQAGSALSPDGQRIALGHVFTGGLHVFDTTTGRQIAGHTSAHASSISAMAFSSDGAKLATADSEGTIKIWEDAQKLTSKSAAIVTLKGHQGAITAVRFAIDGQRLVTTSVDKTARVWDLENAGAAMQPLEGTSKGWSFMARFSSDGHSIACADGNRIRLWDAATGRLARELPAGDVSSFLSVAFSPTDNRLLAVGCGGQGDDSNVVLWDIDAETELVRFSGVTDLDDIPSGASRVVGALAFSPDGKYLVAGFGARWLYDPGGSSYPLKVWEVANRRLIRLKGHTAFCMSLDFSRDGKLLASGSRDGTAILWSTATWKSVQTLHNPDSESISGQSGPGMVEGVAFSPDGKTLAMASMTGNVHLWDVASGKLLETLKGHPSAVFAVMFSPDGRTLASGGTDHTVRLWNVDMRRQLMQLDLGNMELGDMGVMTLAFSPDGMHLLAGARGGSAVWSAAPSVWNDSNRAAEQLRLLLHSNANFQSRVEMLPTNRRLLESLEKLQKILPEDVRVRSALIATRARFFAEQGDWKRAIAEYSKLITDQTADADVLAKRAKAYEATHRWDLARADWRRAIEQQPGIAQAAFDRFHQAERWSEAAEFGLILAEQKPQDSLLWMRIAPVLVLAGDDADYPAYCRRIVEQFAESKDFDVPDKVVKACLLRPEAIELAKLPVDKFAASLDEGSAPDWFPVWAWGTRALLAYRSGEAESAVKYVARSEELNPSDFTHALNQSAASTDRGGRPQVNPGDFTHALNLAVLAMAQHQLRHPAEARRALEEAVELTDRLQSDASSNGDFNLLIAQILLREAETLIDGKTQPKAATEETDATDDKTP